MPFSKRCAAKWIDMSMSTGCCMSSRMKERNVKAKTRPLPTPWTIDVAITHLYCCWAHGQLDLQRVVLRNPNMVNALYVLWRKSHPCAPLFPSAGIVCWGKLVTRRWGSTWLLIRKRNGSGLLLFHPMMSRR